MWKCLFVESSGLQYTQHNPKTDIARIICMFFVFLS